MSEVSCFHQILIISGWKYAFFKEHIMPLSALQKRWNIFLNSFNKKHNTKKKNKNKKTLIKVGKKRKSQKFIEILDIGM